ncbi:MAG: hypothetical protein ACRBBR_12995 [Cellvibrionaceae bacterium]
MNIILRVLPLIIGICIGYILIKLTNDFENQIKFFTLSFLILLLGYFFTFYNIWLINRKNEPSKKVEIGSSKLGHTAMILGAILAGYGLTHTEGSMLLPLLGLAGISFADSLLAKENKSIKEQLNTNKKKDNEDPFEKIKIGAKEVYKKSTQVIKIDSSTRKESILGLIGSLAGYSCHLAIREELIESQKYKEKDVFTIMSGNDGKKYYYGDLPNKPLFENQVSIWSIITNKYNPKLLPNIEPIFSHVAKTAGGEFFGIPQLPQKNMPDNLPLDYIRNFWGEFLPIMDKFSNSPMDRTIILAIAIQHALNMKGGYDIETNLSIKIVMEYAIPMSKVGPEWFQG